MDLNDFIQPGMTNEATFTVEEEHAARQIGSGSMRVLSTPSMIAFMERTSHWLIAEHLPEAYSSVGVRVEVSHLAPTPVGSEVRVKAEVLRVEGVSVRLKVEAWDEEEKVGEGEHGRVAVEVARFLRRVEGKR